MSGSGIDITGMDCGSATNGFGKKFFQIYKFLASTAALEYQMYVFMSVSVSVCPCVTLAIALTKLWTTWTT